ncbi:hypothetical protein HMPREF0497_0900 [Lentilactobacillus buchneri ATCC 11577]|nr:hypothetical protein HMPREF0497_0900 [Lentilactobacillus buchneri ATCC 11577]
MDNQQFLFKRTRIDKSEAVRLIGSSNYPYVDDFIEQHVKNTISLSVTYQMLDKMMIDR